VSDRPRLAATSRTVTGKAVARLRKEGRLPAVVFGHGTESEPVSLDAHEFDQLRRHVGASTLVDLSVDGGKSRPVILHGTQMHKVTHRPIHVDLFAVRMTQELTAEVPLVGDGVPPALSGGGTLVHPTSVVKVRALPGNLPEAIHYDLSVIVDYDTVITLSKPTSEAKS
jgi:large subunit ribosomal protein L25